MAKTAEEIAADEVAAQQKKLDDERLDQERIAELPDDDPEKIAALAKIEAGEDEDEVDPETGEPKAKAPAAGDDEVVISIGGDSPAPEEDDAKAPEWVRELRKNHRETSKRNRELEAENKALKGGDVKPVVLGPKPTLEGCDFDPDKLGSALEAWHDQKRATDDEARKKADEERQAKEAWQARMDAYNKAKAELKVKGAEEAEAMVKDVMTITQQGIILSGADNPALVVVALGKNPKKAKELSAIKDPVKFAFAISKLETQLKVTRKAPPPEETPPSASAPKAGAVDSQLERLRAEAAKSGDFSKVNAYKRDKRQAKRAA